ncbi:uncharacterized protein LOC131548882 isoform X2 [Onychostoma macrolepis]|uniref:uncharacterized protein LOC131548882 isoform X2 n=1 Tax=Onychostoma macrolepis TaxID=369639 RepID=UPI00272BF8B3|nr:uncharacterized protein LOC131548882 isoform X2 [Onychostoma macrolepis]
MDLIVFIAFPLLMEVQSHKSSPTVKVSPDVIRETPADVTVNQCYFITNREEKNIKVSSSCELDLSGAEVLGWAAVKSPGLLNITCYYTIQGIDKPSPHSPATVTVQVLTSTNTEQTTTTAMKTSLPVMSTSETITYSTTVSTEISTQKPSQIDTSASVLPDSTRETETSRPTVPHTVHTHSEDSLLNFCLDS